MNQHREQILRLVACAETVAQAERLGIGQRVELRPLLAEAPLMWRIEREDSFGPLTLSLSPQERGDVMLVPGSLPARVEGKT